MKTNIDELIKNIVNEEIEEIKKGCYTSIAEYITSEERYTDYGEFFEDEEYEDYPAEEQENQVKEYLQRNYNYLPEMEHEIRVLSLSKSNNCGDSICWLADDNEYCATGEFYVDKQNKLHHSHIFPDHKEYEFVVPYVNDNYIPLRKQEVKFIGFWDDDKCK